MAYQTLIDTDILLDHLGDPDWVIVDCRFDLNDPDWGFEEYQELHIPGAVYAHLDKDLSGLVTAQTGRHPLPEAHTFAKKLSEWGIDDAKQVVAYDTVGGAFASRFWWLMRYFGFSNVAILNGGLGKWIREDYPVNSGVEKGKALKSIPTLTSHPELLVTTSEMLQIFSDPFYRVIDARTRERFLGENEPIDPVAGRIPGAVNRFHGENLQPDLTLKPAALLKKEFSALIGDTPTQKVVVYCGSGVTSCHHLLAMEAAGYQGGRLYLGSWSEWIRDPSRPVARG